MFSGCFPYIIIEVALSKHAKSSAASATVLSVVYWTIPAENALQIVQSLVVLVM